MPGQKVENKIPESLSQSVDVGRSQESLLPPRPENTLKQEEKPISKMWIGFTLGATACFALTNEVIAEITKQSYSNKEEGIFHILITVLFYLAPGSLFAGILFHVANFINYGQQNELISTVESINLQSENSDLLKQSQRSRSLPDNNNNSFSPLVDKTVSSKENLSGKVNICDKSIINGKNAKWFILYCLIMFITSFMTVLTMYFAIEGDINIGVVISFWSITPVYQGMIAKIFYNKSLTKQQVNANFFFLLAMGIYMFSMSMTTKVIEVENLKPYTQEEKDVIANNMKEYLMKKDGTILAVLFSLVTPIFHMISGEIFMHMTGDVNSVKKSSFQSVYFGSQLAINLLVLTGAILFWLHYSFDHYLFWIGFACGLFNSAGIFFLHQALEVKSAGPVCSIILLSNILVVFIECLKNQKELYTSEIIVLILTLLGGFIVIPDKF